MKISVLFVCLGNICRSPMAEGNFIDLLQKRELQDKIKVDSAGTAAFHVGKPADQRMREVAFSRGVSLPSRARQATVNDFYDFDYIVAMDKNNLIDLKRIMPSNATAKLHMLREFEDGNTGVKDVPDPYYGGIEDFNEVFEITKNCAQNFLNYVIEKNNIK